MTGANGIDGAGPGGAAWAERRSRRPGLPVLGYAVCAAGLVALSLFLLAHPEVYPAGGFTGPAHWRQEAPAGIRLSGDSIRYLPDDAPPAEGVPAKQGGYRGYRLLVGAALGCCRSLLAVAVLQILLAALSLGLLMDLARRLSGSGRVAVATGVFYAWNPEFAVWHTSILTESVYVSGVILVCWLAAWALRGSRLRRMPAALLAALAVATVRPTGWILPPAVLCHWCLASGGSRSRRLAGIAAVAAALLLASACAPRIRNGIQVQIPARHLYTGTVVWETDIWRLRMPDSAGFGDSLRDGVRYALRHPAASARLALRRLAMMALRVRPAYSRMHNAFLLLTQLPVVIAGLLAMAALVRDRRTWLPACVVLAHMLVVALTFNDHDGRFSLYALPELALLAFLGTERCLTAIRRAAAPHPRSPEAIPGIPPSPPGREKPLRESSGMAPRRRPAPDRPVEPGEPSLGRRWMNLEEAADPVRASHPG